MWDCVAKELQGLVPPRDIDAAVQRVEDEARPELMEVHVDFPNPKEYPDDEDIDEISEYIWELWTSREKVDMQISPELNVDKKPCRIWYWIDDKPFNSTLIVRKKMDEIFAFMAKRPFPQEMLDNKPAELLTNPIGTYELWQDFMKWTAPLKMPTQGKESEAHRAKNPQIQAGDMAEWTNERLVTNEQRFKTWQKFLMIEQFKIVRKETLSRGSMRDKAALPVFTYDPAVERATEWPQWNDQKAASRARRVPKPKR